MAGKTISEKILSAKSGHDARAGDVVVCRVDSAMGNDGSTPMALDYFEAMGGRQVLHPRRIVFALDHYAPAPSQKTTQLHQRMREFAARHGIEVWEIGAGIGHQLMVESGRVVPGSLALGADSHSVTYGALNAFATSRSGSTASCRRAFSLKTSHWRWRGSCGPTARLTRPSNSADRA
jgi:3-isopropylmalate/(R)-2-methylmalate dehydratase large subunit